MVSRWIRCRNMLLLPKLRGEADRWRRMFRLVLRQADQSRVRLIERGCWKNIKRRPLIGDKGLMIYYHLEMYKSPANNENRSGLLIGECFGDIISIRDSWYRGRSQTALIRLPHSIDFLATRSPGKPDKVGKPENTTHTLGSTVLFHTSRKL